MSVSLLLTVICNDLCRVRDAGIWNKLTVESDHAPLQMKLRISRNLSKQTESKGKFINQELLRNPTVANSFRLKVRELLGRNGCQTSAAAHKLALLNLFNRGRQPASWKWCPPHQAGLDLFAHLAYPVEFTYHPLPVIPFPRLNPIYPSLETLLLPPLVLALFQCKVV